MPVGFIYVVLTITIVVLAVVGISPAVTVSRGGKIVAFLALFVFPLLTVARGYQHHMDRSTQTSFCLSYHVMEPDIQHSQSRKHDQPQRC